MNKVRSLAIATATTLSLAGIGVGMLQAAQPQTKNSGLNGLVQAIAQKFNLSTTDVQKVFDDQRAQMDVQRQTQQAEQVKTMLANAVSKGTLTQAQADLVTAKQAEVKTFLTSLEGKSKTERESAIKTQMQSLKTWTQTNNIPPQFLMMLNHGRGLGGPGKGGAFGQDPKARLDQAVKEGKLTQAQEDLLIAKYTEVKTFMDSLKDKSQTDRDAAVKAQTASLTQWVQTNNIPTEFLPHLEGPGMGGRGGMNHGGPRGQRGAMPQTNQ